MSFDKLFSEVAKRSEKDASVKAYSATDLRLASKSPYGIPTGLPRLDLSLGRPGFPAGKIVELFGFEATGKSTAALQTIASAQRMNGGGFLIDTEYSYDPQRCVDVGLDINKNFAIGEADTVEGIFRQIEYIIEARLNSDFNFPFVIVVDSITGTQSERNMTGDFGSEPRIGEDARVIRRGIRRINSKIAESKVLLIFINHAISNAGGYGEQSTSAGGHAIKFYSSVRVNFNGNTNITEGVDKKRTGQKVWLTVKKLKGAKLTNTKFQADLLNDTGFDLTLSLLDAMIETGYMKLSGKTYTLIDPVEQKEKQFLKRDWKGVLDELFGGAYPAYKLWLEWCENDGFIKPWGSFDSISPGSSSGNDV